MNRQRLRMVGAALLAVSVVCLILALTSGGGSGGKMDVSMRAREHIISAVYKLYAMRDRPAGIWAAKTVFDNTTEGCVRDLKVRYRLDQYSQWSDWSKYPKVVPGQTVVDLYYPMLSANCAKLTSRAPSTLRMEYEYVDGAGEKRTGEESKQLTMLSHREIIYSAIPVSEMTGTYHDAFTNTPLIAAWVTPQDKASSGLAAIANERAGGAGASYSDEACWKVMKEAYDVMRGIRITYQSPAGTSIGEGTFDPKLVQTLQYPRDTIRKRSGTCIELALLYASMLKSQGIKPYLVMLPGHCFPMAKASGSGQFVPVEATGVGGGGTQSISFEKAVEAGVKQWKKLQQNGQFILVDVDKCLDMGIVPPELAPLPDDILNQWRLTEMLDVKGGGGGGGGGGVTEVKLKAGQWSAGVTSAAGQTQGTAQVQVQGNNVVIAFTLAYQMTDVNGMVHQCREVNQFSGTIQGNTIQAVCKQAVWTMDGRQMPPVLPINLQLTVAANGRSAQGTATMPNGQAAQVTMSAN